MQVSQSSGGHVLRYQGRNYPLDKPQIVIGSDPRCDISIENSSHVLPAHALLVLRGGQVFLRCLNRNAAIWVNDLPVTEAQLRDRAAIALGDPETRLMLLLNWMPTDQTSHQAGTDPVGADATNVWSKGLSATTDQSSAVQNELATATRVSVKVGEAQKATIAVTPPPIASTPSAAPVGSTDATRYLCAAAHLDARFRNYVMEHIIDEEHRALVVSYGVDVVSVVKYCLATNSRELFRDTILCTLLFVAIVAIITLHFFPLVLLFPLLFLMAWVTVGVERWSRYYGDIAAGLAKGKFHPNNIQFSLDRELEDKLKMLSNTQGHNVIVYSGYSPFIGAGQNIGGWSFVIDMEKGKMRGTGRVSPVAFRFTELYNYLTAKLEGLAIEGLSLEDKLFVNGQEIRDDRRFLADPYTRPYTQVDLDLVQNISESPTQNIRYYKCIQVTSWSGELVLSIFLRFSRAGKNLFMEANYALLTPIREEYRRIDNAADSFTLRKFLFIVLESFIPTFFLCLFSPFALLGRWKRTWGVAQKRRRIEREIDENPAFDYGAISSLRDAASSKHYQRHLQQLDKEMYVKIIQSQLLDSIVEFLDKKNIDTSDLKERQEVILNNDVLLSGGEFKGENIAIGERAKAFVSTMANTARQTSTAEKA